MADRIVQQLSDLFVGRSDVYAVGRPRANNPEKFEYYLAKDYNGTPLPLTPELVRQHLRGELCLGVYSMQDDSTVKWFAVDFDGPKGTPREQHWALALAAGQAQLERLERAGLAVYLERSRSGHGVHVWGFLAEPVEAEVVRRALKPLMVDDDAFDRLYPVQDRVHERKPYGNLIMLPLYGDAVRHGGALFVDRNGEPLNQREWLERVELNPPAVLRLLADKAPKTTGAALTVHGGDGEVVEFPVVPGALKVISEYGCTFLRHCWTERRVLPEPQWYAALQIATQFEHGRSLAHLLSQDYPTYAAEEVDQKFDQAVTNYRVGCSYIHEHFPKFACRHCPLNEAGQRTAPHHLGKLKLLELTRGARMPLRRAGSFRRDLERVSRYDSGEATAGLLTEFPALDPFVRYRFGELMVVGGAPSMGKTALLVDASVRLARQGVPVFVFSAETGEESLRNRLLGRQAHVDTRALRGERRDRLSKAEWERLEAASEVLEALPLYLNFTAQNVDDVLLAVEDAVLRQRIPLDQPYVVFFDYLQYGARVAGEVSDYDRISRLSSEFKALAKVAGRTVVVFSQLVRDAEGEETPKLTWFRGSGRIEQDLDVGLIITGERREGDTAPRSLWVVKQREGTVGKVDMVLQQTFGRWDSPGLAAVGAPPALLGEAYDGLE